MNVQIRKEKKPKKLIDLKMMLVVLRHKELNPDEVITELLLPKEKRRNRARVKKFYYYYYL